ncbi:MAG: hypothetical protein ABIT01_20955 [Thermoanaerobaculia bacterium]
MTTKMPDSLPPSPPLRIVDSATQQIEDVAGDVFVLPMPKETHPDAPRAFSDRESEGIVQLSYTPMGPEGGLAVSRLVRQPLSKFQPGEMVFLETAMRDRRNRTVWRLVQKL